MFCTACGNQIEDGQKFCTSCGQANYESKTTANPQMGIDPPPKKKHPIRRYLFSIIFAVILSAVFNHYFSDPYSNILGITSMREAYDYAQEVILDELLAPSTAVFPDFNPEFIKRHSKNLTYEGIDFYMYTVTAYVDAANAFGTPIRSAFSVDIGLPVKRSDYQYYHELLYFE